MYVQPFFVGNDNCILDIYRRKWQGLKKVPCTRTIISTDSVRKWKRKELLSKHNKTGITLKKHGGGGGREKN
jgi:hypothetical protein